MPEVSRKLKDDEEDAVVHFALHRGSGISGVVRLPDGLPLAGALVLLSTPAHPAQLNNGHPQTGLSDQRVVKTRADGRFNLPPSEPPYTIVVVHDRGHAELTAGAMPAAPPELIIKPWGKIEGTLRIGRETAAGQKLSLVVAGRRDAADVVYRSGYATTDAMGRFEFNRVGPGEFSVSRLIEWKDRNISSSGGSPSAMVDVASGANVRLTVGGTGRPVVGKAALPAEFAGRDDWLYGFCHLVGKGQSTGAAAAAAGERPGSRGPKCSLPSAFKV